MQARARGVKPEDAGWPADGYRGEYIEEIARDYAAAGGKPEDLDAVRKFAVAALRKEQDADLQAFGVKFDVYYLESSLYTDGKVEAAGKAIAFVPWLWYALTIYGVMNHSSRSTGLASFFMLRACSKREARSMLPK
mgnify:CR=1 FL=1